MSELAALDPIETEHQAQRAALKAPLNFIARQEEKPSFHSQALTGGDHKYFYDVETHIVPIGDMREIAETLSIDAEGFEFLEEPTGVEDLNDDEQVAKTYLPEIEALLRRHFGASQVIVFDFTRRSDAETGADNPDGKRETASQVHVDYTVQSGPQRAAEILGEHEFDRLTKAGARILQVNVWRPISGPVERSDLALADASSIAADDLIATDQVFPDRVGEIYMLAHTPTQRWYYAPEMTKDEVLLIKGWDSLDDGRARFTPHGAISPDVAAPGAQPRESIEARAFIVIE